MKKTAVITASTQGIGKAIGVKLLEKGYFVIFNYSRNDEEAFKLERELNLKFRNQYKILKANLSTYEGLDFYIKEVFVACNSIDVLVLNTGITSRLPLEKLTKEIWNNVMDTNLNIPFFTIQKLKGKINNFGRIIFIGSILGQISHATSIPYGVSKAGVHMLANYLVKEFSSRKITVNTLVPGFVETKWQQEKTSEHRKSIENKIALNRFSTTEEIAKACMCIVGNDYINGAEINVDGGYSFK